MKNKISQLRKEKELTQNELANKTGVSRQTIIMLEQNKYNPSLELAYKITKALGKKKIEEVFIF